MNRRRAERIVMEVPVSVEDTTGITRDISSSGIYFTSDTSFQVGGDIRFSLDLEHALPGRPLRLNCRGRVVRTEDLGEQTGVAAVIERYCYLH